ncbi:hypothetical protein G0R83_004968 [Salmonella enterica]|uniref:Bro-N domain-containing protein n=1 Tax=Salmonella enterica TaxID=28901 RepID=A0A749KZL0_SALER|nr:hypothetical protein [Salmonella enterica]EEI4534983.1 hypothetical protein [Salmonella enterica]EJP3911740.1 hypothetical protein [Salmonella enterica]HAF5756229.1 hypothetical protein [Salmonella enterica]
MINPVSHFYFNHSSVRVQMINDEPWFCLADVAKILDIKNTSQLAGQLESRGISKTYTPTIGGKQQLTFINEPNLYRVIFRSNKPEARQFQDWVFNDVLPAIRKTGRYQHPVATRRRTAEPLTSTDMQNLNWLVQNMVRSLRYQGVWTRAIWYSLRQATGSPSPEQFCVEDLPALIQECRRIITVTGLVNEKVAKFEREAARRILRKREDCQMVISQLQREFDSNGLSGDNVRRLERYEQIALARLEQRVV